MLIRTLSAPILPSICILIELTPIFVTNGAIVIHTQRLKSDPGGNLLS
ncbi:coproporphyrinogen III oxidase [Salmonella enterica subsp. enterica]|nr:coproporphyrinogen III oxidase [Salmonella enterica subsp. enterica serovar Coleypark]ECI2451502.1 coproporphyrinogen III oxidase [Salmonella enterica subsp. enterica serovar Coleypark]